MKARYLVLPIIFLVLSCKDGKLTFIEDYGRYNITPEVSLEVSVEGSILTIMTDNKGVTQPLDGNVRASVYHRWFLYWDDQRKNLWLYSGDIGAYYWVLKNGVFGKVNGIDQGENIRNITPVELYDRIYD